MRGRAIRMQANKKFSREMLAAMDEKRERLARQQEEDRLYVLKCKKVCSKICTLLSDFLQRSRNCKNLSAPPAEDQVTFASRAFHCVQYVVLRAVLGISLALGP